ncbi:MAG: peptidylprolyl isomerase [Brachymonas sp.]
MKFKATLIALSLLAGAASTTVWAQNVAIVNGKPVPSSRVDDLLKQFANQLQGRPVTPEIREQAKEAVISREVFIQEAQKNGLDGSDEYRQQMEIARQQLLISALMTDFQKKNPVTDADIKAEYDKFVATNGGKEYRARHILVEKEADATKAIADLKKGAKFEDLAKKISKDPGSGKNGGDLDWAAPGSYVKEFSDAMVKLPKGKYTEAPVKSQFGFHIIRVDDVRETQLPPLEQVKPQIAQQLQQQKLQAYQKGLRDKAKVE